MNITDDLIELIKQKILLYDSQMECATYDDFIRNEWAAGAMRQLLIEVQELQRQRERQAVPSGWIHVNVALPPYIEGQDYSENVLGLCDGGIGGI